MAHVPEKPESDGPRPKIVCLCGSMRFKDEFIKANKLLTLEGCIVLTPGMYEHADVLDKDIEPEGRQMKYLTDKVHREKMKMADEIRFINTGGYIGPSTNEDLEYARKLGKLISFSDNINPITDKPPHLLK